jgi:hypothetical protein
MGSGGEDILKFRSGTLDALPICFLYWLRSWLCQGQSKHGKSGIVNPFQGQRYLKNIAANLDPIGGG